MRASTSAMIGDFDGQWWADADMAAPIALPDWTRGHVLTHIARNADSIARALSGALRGEIVKRYPNGPEGRAADIEAGAGRPVLEQLADVRESADRLDRLFGAVADADAWKQRRTADRAACWIMARWQEVEVHRVDADSGYIPEQWPADFIRQLLPRLADRLPNRTQRPPLVEVTADGSINSDLAGRQWMVPGQEAVEVDRGARSGLGRAGVAHRPNRNRPRPCSLRPPDLDPWM